MGLPGKPVALNGEQIGDLNRKLSEMRHDINNYLATMTLAAELIRLKPETADEMMSRLLQQIPRIKEEVEAFSAGFEQVFGITRP